MANHHPSPTMMQLQQQQQHHAQAAPPSNAQQAPIPPSMQITALNEAVWLQLGSFAELVRIPEEAMYAYERALNANPNSIPAMNAIGMLLKGREAFEKALEFFRAIVQLDQNNGEAWGNLGHCYLMTEDLQKAYDAYQAALMKLRDPKDPMLWYGIGILYDRYGSYDYAEEAFSQVMQIQPDFEKANEIYFRLGIIYKQQSKYPQSLECFKYIVNSPPGPLTQEDIWFQIGHVHEQQKDFEAAKAAYLRVLDHAPMHAKVLQQLGWLYHQQNNQYETQDRAIGYLEKSVSADGSDAQSWYLLGRCYMAQQKYSKAYEAYQQAVYRDGKSPTFWCSIGVLYYQINQYRDALDAYSRAIRLNPYISEVWYDLGTLYESCNNQTVDALDAYQRAADLDPTNPHIKARLNLLQNGNANGAQPTSLPQPTDMHFQSIQAPGPAPQWGGPAPPQGADGPRPPPQGAGERMAIANLNPAPQPSNSFDSRSEPYRAQAVPLVRQPSPRQEQPMRHQYPESGRGSGARRPATPPGPNPYPNQGPPSQSQASLNGERRTASSGWSGAPPVATGPAPSHANGASAPQNSIGSFRPTNSPRLDVRQAADARMPSPKSAYPQHQPPPLYPQQQEAPAHVGSESGPPPPSVAVEAAAQRSEDRPPSVGPKRMREWEEESAVKKQANEENRARLEDTRHRRASTPHSRRNSSEARRQEEQRRAEESKRSEESRPANDAHRPSDAPHQPENSYGAKLPPMRKVQVPAPGTSQDKPAAAMNGNEERPPTNSASSSRSAAPASEQERAKREMDVDENYDDSGEDEKKNNAVNGSGPASTSGEAKSSTPTTATVTTSTGTALKSE